MSTVTSLVTVTGSPNSPTMVSGFSITQGNTNGSWNKVQYGTTPPAANGGTFQWVQRLTLIRS